PAFPPFFGGTPFLLGKQTLQLLILAPQALRVALLIGGPGLRRRLRCDLADIVAQDRDPTAELVGRQRTDIARTHVRLADGFLALLLTPTINPRAATNALRGPGGTAESRRPWIHLYHNGRRPAVPLDKHSRVTGAPQEAPARRSHFHSPASTRPHPQCRRTRQSWRLYERRQTLFSPVVDRGSKQDFDHREGQDEREECQDNACGRERGIDFLRGGRGIGRC